MSERDEARITAYVLGELDAAGRETFEAEMAQDAALRAEVEEVRGAVGALADVWRAEDVVASAAPAAASAEAPQRPASARRALRYASAAAVLAAVTLGFGALSSARFDAGSGAPSAEGAACVVACMDEDATLQQPAASSVSIPADPAPVFAGLSDSSGAESLLRQRPLEKPESGGVYLSRLDENTVQPSDSFFFGNDPTQDIRARTEKIFDTALGAIVDAEATKSADGAEAQPAEMMDAVGWSRYGGGAFGGRRPGGERLRTLEAPSGETYVLPPENPFVRPVGEKALSTFAVDVDTAAYANVRRFLTQGALPPPDAVRIEELINVFKWRDAAPTDDKPLAVRASLGACPWAPGRKLLRVTLKAREIDWAKRPSSNLVFLVDVSGSMDDPKKLPLVQRALQALADRLGENDKVSIVVYAGASGVVLPPTRGDQRQKLRDAVGALKAGGSTNGGEGIQLAYKLAKENFIPGGVNRVLLCTDGDFNVGVTDRDALVRLVEEEAKSGVFLTALGFGMGNLKDATLEQIANKGNGNYGYVDDDREARKLLVDGATGTLVTVAKDVKLQIEFNPTQVAAYRLLGYENRKLAAKDFRDDAKDAGEVGAGHVVTALYEIVPVGVSVDPVAARTPLKYQPENAVAAAEPATPRAPLEGPARAEMLTVFLRWKAPDGQVASEVETPVVAGPEPDGAAGDDLRFASAVAMFGMELRGSAHKGG
ncbi:MAG TPA: VWA domain-containing protein, partial [Planctomycetota bacterium]|nr:VWA domain-containing protein [Planctomycetota bacterium]